MTILVCTLNYNTYQTMLKISLWCLIVAFFYVHCLQRDTWYSRLHKEATNSSLGVLYGEVASFVHCAGLCAWDDYCMELIYSEISRQCIGLHCLNKGSQSYQNVVPSVPQMLYFGKEFNWVEYSGHYYFFGAENVTWIDAKMECQKMCAHLAEVETKEESEWLAATFLMKDSCTILSRTCTAWIGGNDIKTEGQFVWDKSNTTIGFSNWSPGNPSIDFPDQAPTRDCVDLYRDGKWNDRRCTYLNPFICEKSL
nr:aggrecan core protein-like [Crassostrea gigas]